jgi:hypothetical protein
MKKDSKAYPDSGGWGYAIYLGVPAKERNFGKEQMMACHACHDLVKDRDYVFSTALFDEKPKKKQKAESFIKAFKLSDVAKLPNRPKEILNEINQSQLKKIRHFSLPSFPGTINESEVTLGRLALSSQHPLLLWSTNNKAFVFASQASPSVPGCQKSSKVWASSVPIKPEDSSILREMLFCDGVLK